MNPDGLALNESPSPIVSGVMVLTFTVIMNSRPAIERKAIALCEATPGRQRTFA